jgi:hypothetical protein
MFVYAKWSHIFPSRCDCALSDRIDRCLLIGKKIGLSACLSQGLSGQFLLRCDDKPISLSDRLSAMQNHRKLLYKGFITDLLNTATVK